MLLNNITMEETMDIVYNSKKFGKLNDFETHLQYESSSYVYEYLKEELKLNKENQDFKNEPLF